MILYSWCSKEHLPVGSAESTPGLEEIPYAEVGRLRKTVTESESILGMSVVITGQ